ncbi:50S ribosomal protein L25 [bacterium]|nr:50S ribosomal protein L25 [bacterium]
MKQIQLSADVRTTLKKNAMNRLRMEAKVPAVLYGQGQTAVNLQLNDKDIFHAFHSSTPTNVLIKLNILGGESAQEEIVMVKELQRHPVSSKLLHIDFVKISMDKPLETSIPVVVTGTAKGIKEGGMLELVHRDLLVRCLPALLPENISIDVTDLGIADSITVGDLPVGEGVEILVDTHEPVVHVVAPRVEETKTEESEEAAATAAPAAEAKQPEVIGEKEREDRRSDKDKK